MKSQIEANEARTRPEQANENEKRFPNGFWKSCLESVFRFRSPRPGVGLYCEKQPFLSYSSYIMF
jgi:hypothetical protein